MNEASTYTAFVGSSLLASGSRQKVLSALKTQFDQDPGTVFLVFEDETGRQVDFDLRGPLAEVLARYEARPVRSGPGRPRLGVVAREVSLLPRHWEWLERQASGASATIRRLVDEARKRNPDEQRAKEVINAAGRFLTAMAGNFPGYEEASRALYLRNRSRFEALVENWPEDIRRHARRLVEGVMR